MLIGPMETNRLTTTNVGTTIDLNYWDDLGGPKEAKNFYRWNMPKLTYAFDASFINYFGLEGRFAVNEAVAVLNDFFNNEDYTGVSALRIADSKHGFLGNYNTTWVNTTARNSQVLDIKSLTLGLLLNHLGVGNPHRWAFSIHDATTNQANTMVNFRVRLRNYDPLTYRPTDFINGVQYSYRLVHDGTNSPGLNNGPAFIMPTFADMEEFTTDISGNAWSAVAGIGDAFYGNSLVYWTDKPTLFDFGVYFDGKNAMGGKRQPRHALTYDDAGGLKYLYRTNNFVFETLPLDVVLVVPSQLLPLTAVPVFPGPTGRLFPDTLGGNQGFIPRRNTAFIPALPITSVLPAQGPPPFYDLAMRGGVDQMQLIEQPFDSLLGITFTATNIIWTDTFITTNGQTVLGRNNTFPGSELYLGVPTLRFATQTVGRPVFQPDIIFVADDLGLSPDGVPIGWNRTDSLGWIDNFTNNLGPTVTFETNMGPGVIIGPIQFTYHKVHEDFEVLWSGQASVVGNTQSYSLWGHLQGPGPDDIVLFPRDVRMSIVENAVAPATSVPLISKVSDNGEKTSEGFTLRRTEEKLTLLGSLLASVTAIEVLNGNVVVQTIVPATRYIVSDQRMDIPPGVISDAAEGVARSFRVWNTVGVSEKATDTFTIESGRPVITGTSADDAVHDRAQELTLRGYGFKSTESGALKIAYLRVDSGTGLAITPSDGNVTAVTIDVLSDTLAVVPVNGISSLADGSNRRVRVSRKYPTLTAPAETVLSPTNNVRLMTAITARPVIAAYQAFGQSALGGEFRRDTLMEVNGTGLNTAIRIELVDGSGSALGTPVAVDLPHAAIHVEDKGTRIQIAADAFLSPEADGNHSTLLRQFKVFNAVGNTAINSSLRFNVNVQPRVDSLAAFNTSGAWNRDNATGDKITITGYGLGAVGRIEVQTYEGAELVPQPFLELTPNMPGVVVTDAAITIDPQKLGDIAAAGFHGATSADSTSANTYRVFKLLSARAPVRSSSAQRFIVGVPPTFSSLNGTTANNYRRDADTLLINGGGMGMATRVELVDAAGIAIAGTHALDTSGGLSAPSTTQLSIAAKATGWSNIAHLLDSPADLGRRVRVTTPFGVVTSPANSAGAFTVSATPAFGPTAQNTFSGGGYDGSSGNGTYDLSDGNLMVTGQNFRGVKRVFLEDSNGTSYASVPLNPAAPPNGIAFNAEGTQMVITSGFAGFSNWATQNATNPKFVTVLSAANINATSPVILTRP